MGHPSILEVVDDSLEDAALREAREELRHRSPAMLQQRIVISLVSDKRLCQKDTQAVPQKVVPGSLGTNHE
jgi:ADP-ribose pyrophosphatase YjhB (NUDIX family)